MKRSLISELSWDSSFFGRKIGELNIDGAQLHMIEEALTRARKDNFSYLHCKVSIHDSCLTRGLESNGFYLTDVAVTWRLNRYITDYKSNVHVRPASESDIPMARELVTSLFLNSRFYNDPFFKKKEAERLYQTWIDNSIRGLAADAVFLIPDAGLITCRKKEEKTGQIVLVGVRKEMRRKKYGEELVHTALDWFKSEGLLAVNATTQLRNIAAMNFYSRLGFAIKEYYLIFGNILAENPPLHV